MFLTRPSARKPERTQFTLLCLAFFIIIFTVTAMAGNFYAGTSPANVPWPGGIVPYEFTNTLSIAQQQAYLDGVREWELAANVKFVPHTNQTRWILFTYNTNFLDFVATGYNPQVITVADLSRAQVCHEMGHSFGFTHENIRPDQANYIIVDTNNITDESSNIYWFTIDPTSVTNGNYDFESVMHLGWDFQSVDPGVLPTQIPRPAYFPRYQYRMGNLTLSPGDRAALKYLYGPPSVPLTNVVTTTADVGPGSLRAALYYVTDNPGSVVQFNIPTNDPGYSNGVFNIHLTGELPTVVSNGMVIDGSTQPGFAGKPLIAVNGSQILYDPRDPITGLLIYSASNLVKDISFSGFIWNGLTLLYQDATNNTISGCWLGVDSTGTNPAPNTYQGILIASGSSGNTIGGTNAGDGNVLSGNLQYGLFITDSNTDDNVVEGNYIGTDPSGLIAVPNQVSGMLIGAGAYGNTVGSTNPLGRNVLSGNVQYGVFITDNDTTNNTVIGNYAGTDATGTNALANGYSGVFIGAGASENIIGSTNAAGRNILSGNAKYGVYITDPNTSDNAVLGNYIGTDVSGSNAVANGYGGVIVLGGVSNNIVGGSSLSARNVISGNTSAGLWVGGSGTVSNIIQGNLVGLNASGKTALPNSFVGMYLYGGGQSNLVLNNVFSGQPSEGLRVTDPGTSDNTVQGNYFGTDVSGSNAIPNEFAGLSILAGATSNTIGGVLPNERNVISGNYYGLVIGGQGTSGNMAQGNLIGTEPSGRAAVPNTFAGVAVTSEATDNLIGGTVPGAANIVSGNSSYGFYLRDTNTSGNEIEGNIIGADISGANALANGTADVDLLSSASGNFIGGISPVAGNIIAFAVGPGVVIYDPATTNNAIRGNSIFGNGSLGINFNNAGVAQNHVGFAAGPNDLQNYPVITNAYGYKNITVVAGTLNSLTNQLYYVDVYRNAVADPSGYGQGQTYVGTVNVMTDGSGNGFFALTNEGNFSGQYLTTTATSASGDTSEFSHYLLATNAPVPSAQFTGPIQWGANGISLNLTLQTNFSYHIQATTNLGIIPVPWVNLTNFTATNSAFSFVDHTATNYHLRFYRVVSP